MNTTELSTLCGPIKGISHDTYTEYRGIKYAEAKRWEYPSVIEKWDGVYDATSFGACCFQRRGFEDDAVCSPFYHKEFRADKEFTYSEDCLFLNIYAPKNKTGCPVLVYIHGGSFTGGSADEGHVDGRAYAERGIIFVSINYRLGPFGFCSHPDLKNDEGVCGNYGLFDQFAALQWVKNNIEAFGGDKNKITLLGQSAGAMSVDIQVSNPMAEGFFSGAVLMSGAALQRGILKPVTPEKSKKFWDKVIELSGSENIEELRTADAKTLFYAWLDAQKAIKTSMLFTLPVYDGKLLCKGKFSMNTIPDIPYIIGVTKNDMMPAVLEFTAKKWAAKARTNVNMCYIYNFMRSLPGDDLGAWHSADLPYAFATLQNNWRPFEEIDYAISEQMVESISAFVRTGDPNCDAIPLWSTEKPLHFCENTKSEDWHTKELIHNTFSNNGPI